MSDDGYCEKCGSELRTGFAEYCPTCDVAISTATARAEKAETEISSLLTVIDKAVDCYFNDRDIKDAMYALRRKVEPK